VDSLSDGELAELEAEAEADADAGGYADETAAALSEYGAEFANHYATTQARASARADADEQDRQHPAVRTEDVLARALSRIGAGTYTSEAALASQRTAIELSRSSGLCSTADPVTGMCSARYHELTCSGHAAGSDGHVELANGGGYAWKDWPWGYRRRPGGRRPRADPGRRDRAGAPAQRGLGLHSGATAYAYDPEADDLFSVSRHRDAYSDLARELGRDDLIAPQPEYTGYPAVSELARELGLK